MQPEWRIDAFIGGAEKSGTTSLGYYVSQHPDIDSHFYREEKSASHINEFTVFTDDRWQNKTVFEEEYLNAFGHPAVQDKVVVAKHVGVLHRAEVAASLKEFYPSCKIIVMLRNPIDRAYSSFWHQRYRGEEPLANFEEAIELELGCTDMSKLSSHRQYLGRSRYAEQLDLLFDLFGKNNVHIILMDEFISTLSETMNGIFRFLELPDFPVSRQAVSNQSKSVRSPFMAQLVGGDNIVKSMARRVLDQNTRRRLIRWLRLKNSVDQKPGKMKAAMRQQLLDYFRPYNARLGNMVHRDLGGWDK